MSLYINLTIQRVGSCLTINDMDKELKYREKRIDSLEDNFSGKRLNRFLYAIELPTNILNNFKTAVYEYVAKAIKVNVINHIELTEAIDNNKHSRVNVTPNGGVVPKVESQFEFNKVLKSWHDIFSYLQKKNAFRQIRIFPSIRIKESKDSIKSTSRPFSTSYPHSDSWVDGYWGLNLHIPLFGDVKNNCLKYYELKNDKLFNKKMLGYSQGFDKMQWVLNDFKIIENLKAPKDYLCVSDYLLLHNTTRTPGAKSRVSVDSSVLIGDHNEKDFDDEYTSCIPEFGTKKKYVTTMRDGEFVNKKKSTEGFSFIGSTIENEHTNF